MQRKGRPPRYPEFLAAIAMEVTKELIAAGMGEDAAIDIGLRCAERTRRSFGGEHVYITKGSCFTRANRDKKILNDFDGTNRLQICREHGISEQRFYQILAAERARGKSKDHGIKPGN